MSLQLGASCGDEHVSNHPAASTHGMLSLSFPQPEMDILDCIRLVNWQSVGLQLGVDDYELQKIQRDYHHHDDRKREMFRAWLCTGVDPNYDDLIKALEAVEGRSVAQQLRDKLIKKS